MELPIKTCTASVVGSFVLVAGAHAQTLAISVLSSVDNGATWHSNVDALPGSTVQVGIWMSSTGNVYGVGGGTLRLTATGGQNDGAAFAAGTQTGRVGPFNFGTATNAIYGSAGGFRIDSAADQFNSSSTRGLTFFQRDPRTAAPGAFNSATSALCFRFDVAIENGGTDRNILMTLDQLSRGLAAYYSSSTASRPVQLAASLNAGSIHVIVPAPATLAMLGLGGLSLARRRRA